MSEALAIDTKTGKVKTTSSSVGSPGKPIDFGNVNVAGLGSAGPQGPPGPQGIPGPTGATGAPGPTGATGATGSQGTKGDPGSIGSQGVQGVPGPQGDQGIQGGVGPQGPKGNDGTSVVIKGSVATPAALPPTGNTPGDLWITLNTGHGWVWGLPGQWSDIGPIQGPPGATGATGATGAQGPKGNTGSQGPQGNTGATGATGAQGLQGVKGDPGATGSTGTTGAQGPQGIQGPQGSPGTQGAVGPGVAPGGTMGQILRKTSSTDFGTEWKGLASSQGVPTANPQVTGIAAKMFGVGATITPIFSGKVLVIISLSGVRASGGGYAQVGIRYGSGAVPANGALVSSLPTAVAVGTAIIPATDNSGSVGGAIAAVVTGLTLGVRYWFDLSGESTVSTTVMTAYLPTATLVELP